MLTSFLFTCRLCLSEGEKYISSNVWVDPADSSFQTLESDSCSSWPGRSGVPNSRAISLSRTASSTVAETSAKSVVHDGTARQMTVALMGNADRSNPVRHSYDPRSNAVNRNTKFAALPVTQLPPSPKASLQGFGYLHHLLHFMAFTICLAGISLPVFTHDLNGLLNWAFPADDAKQQTQISVPTDICQLHTGPYSSRPCTSCNEETYRNSYSEDDRSYEDDFSRHSHLAVLSFKAAFANICGALRTMNALTVIANLSWFFLGLLVMHTRRRNL
ncbi:hypothetical protein AHF37_03622 [Paragonimus kellicotti]|nr:hypothetical protein AHF37_03622 [Paragonimus kellicotti]